MVVNESEAVEKTHIYGGKRVKMIFKNIIFLLSKTALYF